MLAVSSFTKMRPAPRINGQCRTSFYMVPAPRAVHIPGTNRAQTAASCSSRPSSSPISPIARTHLLPLAADACLRGGDGACALEQCDHFAHLRVSAAGRGIERAQPRRRRRSRRRARRRAVRCACLRGCRRPPVCLLRSTSRRRRAGRRQLERHVERQADGLLHGAPRQLGSCRRTGMPCSGAMVV